ncbi:MAG: lysoplasmalogenase [Acutalibacteraceae bacterium]|nr:lysoplasmalogenase [Acutalibacteraceae bacterium]
MSPFCVVLAVLTVAFAAGCIALRRKNKAFEGMLCKFMASFGFISVAVVGYSTNPVDTYYFCLVCFALMFGFCGDILLGIKEIAPTFRGKLVPLGLLYFLVGHIFYLCAFIRSSSFSFVALAVGIVFGIGAFIAIKALKMKADSKMRVIMSVYYAVLAFKAASALNLALSAGQAAYWSAFAGAVLFIFSDTCLGFLYFTPVKKKNIFVTAELSTYYAAQILLAMSVALLK